MEELLSRQLSTSELENFPSLDWFEIAPRTTPEVRSSLERILETQDGASVSQEAAFTLAHAEGDDLLGLLDHLPAGVSELYCHPADARVAALEHEMPGYRHVDELAALTSPAVRRRVAALGVRLISFGDLAADTR